ncbi:MAG: TetR/AcrR family transcriptional regulator [Anaerolineae bacterium]
MDPTPGMERRQRREAQRRQEILQAAMHVFAARGYHAATTREIAEAADVAEGTVFNYFPSKHDLLLAVFEAGARRMLAMVGRLDPAVPLQEELTARLEKILGFYVENRLFAQVVIAEVWTDMEILRSRSRPALLRIVAHLESFLNAQVQAGRLPPSDMRFAAQMLIGMVAALVLPIVRGVQPPPEASMRRQLAQQVVSFFLHGLHGSPVVLGP